MATKRKEITEARKRELEEERINRLYYEDIIRDPKSLLKALVKELDYLINYSKYLPTLRKERPDIYADLKAWFKKPDHMNSACNILKTIDKLYTIPDEEKTGLLAYIFDNYEIQAYLELPDSSQRRKYKRLEVKRELKARRFKKLENIKLEDGYYVGNLELNLYYPKAFTEEEKDQALFLYGLNCTTVKHTDLLVD